MYVICINNINNNGDILALTIGKSYKIVEAEPILTNYHYIIDDRRKVAGYTHNLFITQQEARENKLNKILQ